MKFTQIFFQQNTLLLLMLFLLSFCKAKKDGNYKVIGVKDGDTIELLVDNSTLTVQLYGVDCPEGNEHYSKIAEEFTKQLAFGKIVKLHDKGKDRYGRTIGEIFLPNGKSLNKELVANGYAWYYRAYANDPQLGYLENDARRLERGLWSQPNPVAPWEFRKNKREKSKNTSQTPIARLADADREVFICPMVSAGTYHVKPDCPVLKRCKSQIEAVTRGHAVMNLRRTACKVCSKKR